MNTVDFTDPGLYEYFLLLIGLVFVLWLFFIIGALRHNLKSNQSIVDNIRARGPHSTTTFNADGTVDVEIHKTPEDIRRDIADEYGLTLDQVVLK